MNEAQLAIDLVFDEGEKLKPYRDTRNLLSIGVGHNLDANGISQACSRFMLNEDIHTKAIQMLDHYLPWWETLPEPQARALCNMTFNLGIGGVLGFHQYLHALQLGQYPQAAQALRNSKVYQQLPNRYGRLCKLIDPNFRP